MRTFPIVTALLLLAGCQQSPNPPAPAAAPPAPAPAAQTPDPAAQKPLVETKEKPKKDRFPLDQDQFKTGVAGATRDQVLAKYGPPDEVFNLPAGVGWDGPLSIYLGPFTSADGKKAAKARIYFRRSGASSVVGQVDFVNQ